MSDDIGIGDRFLVPIEIIDWPNEDTPHYSVRVVSEGLVRTKFGMPGCELQAATRLPRPPKVGDKVSTDESAPLSGVVEWTDGKDLLIRWPAGGLSVESVENVS